jgi:hypothetical protein
VGYLIGLNRRSAPLRAATIWKRLQLSLTVGASRGPRLFKELR